MKKVIILLIFVILLVNPAIATTIEETLHVRESIESPGYNISLLSIGNKEKSIVVCINNKINIVNKGEKITFEDLKIEPTKIYEEHIKLKITSTCKECVCDESCSNSACFNTEFTQEENEITNNTQKELQINQQENNQQYVKEKNNLLKISIILFIIVVILLVILLTKKRGK